MAFTTGNQVLPGYEMSIGDKLLVAFDHTGPASYVQFVSPTTGGEVIQAASGGLNRGGFDRLQMGTDTTGQISAVVIPLSLLSTTWFSTALATSSFVGQMSLR